MAIARTRPLAGPAPHPGEVLRDELEAAWPLRSCAAPRAAPAGVANRPNPARPAGDHAGDRPTARPVFRRLRGDLATPAGGLRPFSRRDWTGGQDCFGDHPRGSL